MTVRIRAAAANDAAALARIAREAYAPYLERIGRPPAPMLDDYAAVVGRGGTWVAEDADGVCGFAVLDLAGRDAVLENVAVADRARGRGVGRVLIGHAEQVARDGGFDRITLYTNEAMSENRRLYPRLGYRETHRATEHGLRRVYFGKALRRE